MAQDGGAGGVETFLNANEEIVAITEARMARYRKLMRPFNDYTRLWRTGSKRKFCKQANRLLRSLEYPERLVLYPVRQSMRFRATPVAVHEDDEQQVQSPPVLNENVVFPVQQPPVGNEDAVFPVQQLPVANEDVVFPVQPTLVLNENVVFTVQQPPVGNKDAVFPQVQPPPVLNEDVVFPEREIQRPESSRSREKMEDIKKRINEKHAEIEELRKQIFRSDKELRKFAQLIVSFNSILPKFPVLSDPLSFDVPRLNKELADMFGVDIDIPNDSAWLLFLSKSLSQSVRGLSIARNGEALFIVDLQNGERATLLERLNTLGVELTNLRSEQDKLEKRRESRINRN